MGLEKIPKRKNQQRGAKEIPRGANMHNLRLQDRLHRTRIQNRPPGNAMLKIDFRLVYNQNPKKLLSLLKDHLNRHGFDDIQVKALGFLEPSRTKPSAPIARAAAKAAKIAYGLGPVVLPRNPASGPDYLFTKRLGLDSIWTGSGPPSAYSHAHAPNEYTTTDDFIQGIRYISAIMQEYAATN